MQPRTEHRTRDPRSREGTTATRCFKKPPRSQRIPRRRFAPAGHDEAAAAFAEEAGLDPDPKHASLQSRGVVRHKTDFFGFLSRKKGMHWN